MEKFKNSTKNYKKRSIWDDIKDNALGLDDSTTSSRDSDIFRKIDDALL